MPPEAKALPFSATAYEEGRSRLCCRAGPLSEKPTKEELDAITKLITNPKLCMPFALGLLLDMGPMAPVEPLTGAASPRWSRR